MIKRNALVLGNKSLKDVTEDIVQPLETMPGKGWAALMLSANTLFLGYILTIATVIANGMGLLGVNHPVGWGTMIITFVFWIGIYPHKFINFATFLNS